MVKFFELLAYEELRHSVPLSSFKVRQSWLSLRLLCSCWFDGVVSDVVVVAMGCLGC